MLKHLSKPFLPSRSCSGQHAKLLTTSAETYSPCASVEHIKTKEIKSRILKIGWLQSKWKNYDHQFSSAQLLSHIWLLATPWTTARQASLSITNSQSPPKPMSIESVKPPTISSSVVPFSSCPQSFPASGSFPMSQPFAWGGQSIGVSASASVLPVNTQDWSQRFIEE